MRTVKDMGQMTAAETGQEAEGTVLRAAETGQEAEGTVPRAAETEQEQAAPVTEPAEALPGYLKRLRRSSGYRQAFVAAQLGIARQTYSHYETGRITPPAKALYRLAKLYGISVEDLFRHMPDASGQQAADGKTQAGHLRQEEQDGQEAGRKTQTGERG